MLMKSWKHLSVFLGILFFGTIAGGALYLVSNHSRKNTEPVKIYRTVQPIKKSPSDTASSPSLDQTDKDRASAQFKVSDTEVVRKNAPSTLTPSAAIDVSTPSDELGKQNADVSNSVRQQSEKELAQEKTLQRIAKLEADIRRTEDLIREHKRQVQIQNSSDYRKGIEAKQRALAKELNTLSAEKQRAYFEKGAETTAKAISEYNEKQRANQTGDFKEIVQQILPELSAEEWMKRNIESLRRYGFKPKF